MMASVMKAEPSNPKLKDSVAFTSACEDVSKLINVFVSFFPNFRHWNYYECFKDGSIERFCVMDGKTSVVLFTCD